MRHGLESECEEMGYAIYLCEMFGRAIDIIFISNIVLYNGNQWCVALTHFSANQKDKKKIFILGKFIRDDYQTDVFDF